MTVIFIEKSAHYTQVNTVFYVFNHLIRYITENRTNLINSILQCLLNLYLSNLLSW